MYLRKNLTRQKEDTSEHVRLPTCTHFSPSIALFSRFVLGLVGSVHSAYLIGSMHMHTFPYIVHIANHHVFNVVSLFTRRISICLFCSTQSCVGQLMILRDLWYWKIGIRTFSILFSNWRSGTSDLSSSLHNNKSLAVLLLLIFVHAKWR